MAEWRNWSGSVAAQPSAIERPKTEAEAQRLVAAAAKVRVVGTGHSFMPLCATDGLMLSLSDLDGEIELAADGQSVWVPAGMAIGELTAALWAKGYCLINQGDIDKQAIAGAISTATHGTGRALGSLAAAAEAFRIVLADGQVLECDREREPQLFEAARLSLGMLGVIVRVRIKILPAYRLEERLRRASFARTRTEWDNIAGSHRHAEFFQFPYADNVLVKTLDVVEGGDSPAPGKIEETVLRLVCDVSARWPSAAPTLQRLITSALGSSRRAGPAGRIFPSERNILFEEMEYEIPARNGLETFARAVALVREKRWPILFPLEFRTVAADDIWLSPMNAGECVSISFHQYARMPWREAFDAVEQLFQEAGGRPHWAKRHTLSSADVVRLYPDAERWGAVRKRYDPAGKFLNDHLAELFAFSL